MMEEFHNTLRRFTVLDQPLDERTINPDPIKQFQLWFDDARESNIEFFDAMTLATVSANGQPSARVMLLKSFDDHGFVFYTNYGSRKANELSANPRVSLVFHWKELLRQVRIEGVITKVSEEESETYFRTRLRESQIGAHASAQSQTLRDRGELDRRVEEIERRYQNKEIPRPQFWGGYRVAPARIEFWQGRSGRLHDRILYTRQKSGAWERMRLAP